MICADGFSNQFVVAVAPIMAEIASRLPALKLGFKGMGDTILEVVGTVGGSIAALWDDFGAESSRLWGVFLGEALVAVEKIGDAIETMLKSKLGTNIKDTILGALIPATSSGRRM